MRQLFGVGLAVAVFALVAGCGKKSTTADGGGGGGGPTSIEGEYLIVGMEQSGDAATEAEIKEIPDAARTVKITADTIDVAGDKAKYTTNTSATPYQIDIVTTRPGPAGKDTTRTSYGIYKVDGDKLLICTVRSDKTDDRPKEFKTQKGSDAKLLTLKKK